jgi:prepilin-type processing-associated H-X9-DG protein
LPSVIYDPQAHGDTYTAFTGPDDPNPFASGSKVQPNDVTASLFLLMREGYISNGTEIGLSLYVCPSSDDYPDRLTDAKGKTVKAEQRSNFRSPRNLSYGYCSPFSSAPKFRLNTDWLSSDFAVMADKGPGKEAAIPARSAPPIEMRKANSNNHGEAGQNVLYGDGHVAFMLTPYCGYGDRDSADNIYTAAAPAPTTQTTATESSKGYFGRKYAPSSWGDSYLVPSEADE